MNALLITILSFFHGLYCRVILPTAYKFFVTKFPRYTLLERDEVIYLSPPFVNCTAVQVSGAGSRARINYSVFIEKDWVNVETVLNDNRVDLKINTDPVTWEEVSLTDPRARPIQHLILSFYQYSFLSPYMKTKNHRPLVELMENK